MTNHGIEVTKIEQPARARKTTKKSPAKAKASAKKTVEIKEEVKDVANDVSEKLKAELEQVISENLEQAPVDSKLNKALRNAAIVCGIILVAAIAWNIFG